MKWLGFLIGSVFLSSSPLYAHSFELSHRAVVEEKILFGIPALDCLASGGKPDGKDGCRCMDGSEIIPPKQCPGTKDLVDICVGIGGRATISATGFFACECPDKSLRLVLKPKATPPPDKDDKLDYEKRPNVVRPNEPLFPEKQDPIQERILGHEIGHGMSDALVDPKLKFGRAAGIIPYSERKFPKAAKPSEAEEKEFLEQMKLQRETFERQKKEQAKEIEKLEEERRKQLEMPKDIMREIERREKLYRLPPVLPKKSTESKIPEPKKDGPRDRTRCEMPNDKVKGCCLTDGEGNSGCYVDHWKACDRESTGVFIPGPTSCDDKRCLAKPTRSKGWHYYGPRPSDWKESNK